MVSRLPAQLPTDRLPHDAARAVAADDVPGVHFELRARSVDPAQRDADRVLARLSDGELDDLQAVVGLEPARGAAHRAEEEVVDPRLVEDHVRELGEAVLHVLDTAGADDARAIVGGWAPEDRLVHPVGLGDELFAEPERLEHLHRATRDAVGLAQLEWARLALDDPRGDAGKFGELRREHESRWTTADDQHVDLVRHGGGPCSYRRICRPDAWIPGPEPVAVELHRGGASRRGRARR